MSLGITHFAVGAAGTALILAVVAPTIRYRGTIITLGGIWALIPDIGKLYPHPLFLEFHDSRLADLFWFHLTMDTLDPGDSVVVATVAVGLYLIVMVVTEYGLPSGSPMAHDAEIGIGTDDD